MLIWGWLPDRNRLATELLDIVDDEDVVIGRRLRNECLTEGILHRAIALLLFDEFGRLYIQRRADSKSWYPDYWTLSVMGHVSSGETYEQAAKRELTEELALDCQLRPVTRIRMPDYPWGGLLEREFVTVFEARATNPNIVLSEETKEGKFVEFDEFVRIARKQPEKFTPDSLLALEAYLEVAGYRQTPD